ncbi:unnamed protein product [Ectocarpus sp. 13 AM-2016]
MSLGRCRHLPSLPASRHVSSQETATGQGSATHPFSQHHDQRRAIDAKADPLAGSPASRSAAGCRITSAGSNTTSFLLAVSHLRVLKASHPGGLTTASAPTVLCDLL